LNREVHSGCNRQASGWYATGWKPGSGSAWKIRLGKILPRGGADPYCSRSIIRGAIAAMPAIAMATP
jgi:hypothetical protein